MIQRHRAYSEFEAVIDADGFVGNVVLVGYGHISVVLVGYGHRSVVLVGYGHRSVVLVGYGPRFVVFIEDGAVGPGIVVMFCGKLVVGLDVGSPFGPLRSPLFVMFGKFGSGMEILLVLVGPVGAAEIVMELLVVFVALISSLALTIW